jgi:hypothetical protein
MRYDGRMSNAETSGRMPQETHAAPAFPAAWALAGGAAFLLAAGALWWRFGEGVYGRALLDAVIACF